MLTSEERTPLLPSARLALTEGQAVSQRGGVLLPPMLRNGAVNGGSAGGDPVPHFGGGSGGVLDFTAASASTEMMETSAPSSSTITKPSSSSSPSSPPSLYAYLEELIGEGLTLSLSVPAHCCTPSPKPPPSKPPLTDTPKSSNTTKHVNRSLERFLSGEGFKPVCVQLPKRAPPLPSVPRGYYKGREPWTFSVPQAVLPVQGNPLEQQGGGAQSLQGVHKTPPPSALKGACAGLRRHRHRDHCPIDIAASWI